MCSLAPQWRTLLVKELRRKAIHLSGLSVPLAILLLGRTYTAVLIALALAVSLVLEAGRLKGKIRLPEVRDQEEEKVARLHLLHHRQPSGGHPLSAPGGSCRHAHALAGGRGQRPDRIGAGEVQCAGL